MKKLIIGFAIAIIFICILNSCGSTAPCPVYADNTQIEDISRS